ncbi:MAG: AAA family ATPase [Candidatus Thiodiazotropha sp.]
MTNPIHVRSVEFSGYKALERYTVRMSHLNILVGPNNCGKSTAIGAFRVLALALRKARSKRAEMLVGPNGREAGWRISEEVLPISIENIHTNYAEIDTTVEFKTSGPGTLTLYFPERGGCMFFVRGPDGPIRSPVGFKSFPFSIQVVPVLGPLEHEEPVLTEGTVRQNLATTRAARHFRNYWKLFPEGFGDFREMIRRTWPGMDIEPPENMGAHLAMFCKEGRIDREIYWVGFGFQVWCQMLTHLSRVGNSSLVVVDEPEVYLHPEIQRQLLAILRDLGPDILMATHSTEIMIEADPSEILLIDKSKRKAERLRDVESVQAALHAVGSVQNITLTQLARNRRLLFVEGESDFRLIRRFARKVGLSELASGTDLTSIASGGFSSWERIRALASGFETALGSKLHVGAVFDRDFWCDEQLDAMTAELTAHLEFAHIHLRKEIENYLLLPSVLERALDRALDERARRTGTPRASGPQIGKILEEVTIGLKEHAQSQYIAKRLEHFGGRAEDTSTITAKAINIFEKKWKNLESRVEVVPGKETLAGLRDAIASHYSVSLTDHRIVTSFEISEIPDDLNRLLEGLEKFRSRSD